MAIKVLFSQSNRVNNYETFQYRCSYHDRKFHQSSHYTRTNPVWRRWKGGFRLRGHTHQIFNKNFHHRYNSPRIMKKISRDWTHSSKMSNHYNVFHEFNPLKTSFS